MYFSIIESFAGAKAKHNANMKANAQQRMKKIMLDKKHAQRKGEYKGKPEVCKYRANGELSKAGIMLNARIDDWKSFTSNKEFKAPDGACHKPGSLNRY